MLNCYVMARVGRSLGLIFVCNHNGFTFFRNVNRNWQKHIGKEK